MRTNPRVSALVVGITALMAVGACRPESADQGPAVTPESSSGTATASAQTQGPSSDETDSSTMPDSTSSSGSEQPAPQPDIKTRFPLRRLTATQYRNALRTAFAELDPDLLAKAAGRPQAFSDDAFANDSRYQSMSPALLREIQDSARAVANQVAKTMTPAQLGNCSDADTPQACIQRCIDKIGSRLFRQPMSGEQVQDYLALYQRLQEQGSAQDALAGLMQALIASPYFHYVLPRVAPEHHDDLVAARLALFLWDDLPDAQLIAQAKQKTLSDPKVLHAQATRMLQDPRSKAMMHRFYLEMLRLGRVQVRSPHAALSRQDLLDAFADHIDRVYANPTLKNLWTMPVTFASDAMTTAFPGSYPGLLAHPLFTWVHAKPSYSDPIRRGAVIRAEVFCSAVRAPPPDVEMLLPPPRPDATTRERFEIHRDNPGCAACHAVIDPLGFGLEAYDHLGRFRSEENGKPIDDRGTLVGTDINGSFVGASELSQRLLSSEEVRSCLAEQWLTYAMGRKVRGKERELHDKLTQDLAIGDGDLHALLLSIATSDVITYQEPIR